MLLNGYLFNSEAWHAISEEDIKTLEKVDQHLLRSLVNGHAKTPIEFLFLETGAIPVRFILTSRRLIYLQTILKRPETELIRRIYNMQVEDPSPGEFVELVKRDRELIEETLGDDDVKAASVHSYKKHIKTKVKKAAFKYLTDIRSTHSKIKNIKYDKMETQPYLTSPLFNNEEVNLLFSLRSRSVECKDNFKGLHGENLSCSLCPNECKDDQPHILLCPKTREKLTSTEAANADVLYEHIFENAIKQKEATVLFANMLDIRTILLNEQKRI